MTQPRRQVTIARRRGFSDSQLPTKRRGRKGLSESSRDHENKLPWVAEGKQAGSSSQGCATWGERLPLPGPHFSPQLHESPLVQMTNEGQSNCPLKFSKTYA